MPVIRYYVGSMFAGKSYQGLQLLHSAHTHHKIIVAPTARKRGFITRKAALEDLDKTIYLFERVAQIPAFLLQSQTRTTIMIDEVQFNNDPEFWHLLEKALHHDHLQLILVGLDYDQHGIFFPNHQKILDQISPMVIRHLHVPCATCHSPEGAVSIRQWHSEDRIIDDYAVLCLACFQGYYHESHSNDTCAICQKVTHYLHPFRQWHHDDATLDSHARLCGTCYQRIKNYGYPYKQEVRL